MPNSDRKNPRIAEPNLAMMAEMQRINEELHTLGDEMVSRVNALLKTDATNAGPHPSTDEAHENRRSA